MKIARLIKIITIWLAICALSLSFAVVSSNCPVNAEGGLGISGSFSSWTFEIPQGSSMSGPDIYVAVFNNRDQNIRVNMSSECPIGVNIILYEPGDESSIVTDFDLEPGGYKIIDVRVEVTLDAIPTDTTMSITATEYTIGGGGIQIGKSGRLNANLKIVGESATANVQAVSPDGTPVIATIRLFKQIGSNKYEVAYSETGILNAIVSPGNYSVEGYVGGELLDEESFEIAADETKTITLTVGTIYFAQFDILEYTNTDTGEFAFAEMVYTINNVYEQEENAAVLLDVKGDNEPLEQKQIGSFSPLPVGSFGQSYQYTPLEGWTTGDYKFKLILKIANEIYTSSPERQINVTVGNGHHDTGNDSNIPLIVGIVCAVIVLLAIAFFIIYRRRKRHQSRKQKGEYTPHRTNKHRRRRN